MTSFRWFITMQPRHASSRSWDGADEQTRTRLLYLQPSSNFGGAERQASIAVPLLSKLGFDITTMLGPSTSGLDWLREYGVEDLIHTPDFPGGWRKPRGLQRLALPALYYRCVRRVEAAVRRVVLQRRIDIIYAAMAFSWVAATPIARRLGIPIVWRAGGTEGNSLERLALRLWARRHRPDLLICCGEGVRRTFAPLIPAPAVVVPNGVDTERFHPRVAAPVWYRPPGASVVIGFGARLAPQKRPEDVIRAAALLAPDYPGAAFVIAGEGSRRDEYEALARSLGVGGAVRFVGYVPDMRSFYASVDIVVLPSRSEGCPNVVLESMAMRRALVVSDSAGTREVVTDGVTGLMYPVGDIGALTGALRRLLDNPALRASLARRGNEHAVRGFDAQASAVRLAGVLRRVLRPGSETSSVIPVPSLKEAART
ncbi:MAG TPA: glycosyltransferase family 4 protein [Polyangia bacterium]|nr:glycosyltransferase family 4 protein [Polyangia bacterium]